MNPAGRVAAITAISAVALGFGYLRHEGRAPIARRAVPVLAAPEPDSEPVPRAEIVTTQTHLVTTPPTPAAAPEVPAAGLDEPSLMSTLRALGPQDAERALQLAREGNERFPNGPDAAERSWAIAKSLASLHRFHEARQEAELTVQRYPGTSWAEDVERHLLRHPLDLPSREEQQELDRQEELGDIRP